MLLELYDSTIVYAVAIVVRRSQGQRDEVLLEFDSAGAKSHVLRCLGTWLPINCANEKDHCGVVL